MASTRRYGTSMCRPACVLLSIIFLLPGDQICEVLLLASKIGPEAPLFLTLKHQLRLRILCYGKGLCHLPLVAS